MEHYLLPAQLRDELIRYLLARPCGEVMNAVVALQQLEPAQQAETPTR